MKIIVNKVNNNIGVKLEIDGKEIDFKYIDFIDKLYSKEKIEDITFNNIEEWEKTKISELVKQINDTVKTDSPMKNDNIEIKNNESNENIEEPVGVL